MARDKAPVPTPVKSVALSPCAGTMPPQEVIVQNFRAKRGTLMAGAPEPPLEELLWTVAMARIILGPHMSIQVRLNRM